MIYLMKNYTLIIPGTDREYVSTKYRHLKNSPKKRMPKKNTYNIREEKQNTRHGERL